MVSNGLEIVSPRAYFLRSGRFGCCLLDSLGVFGFPGIAGRFSFCQLLMELFEFADVPVSLGQPLLDFMERGSVLRIPFTELHFEPMDPALRRLQFLDSRAKSIDVCTVMLQDHAMLMRGEQLLFLEDQRLLGGLARIVGLLKFLCLGDSRGLAVGDAREECGLSGFQCRQPLPRRSQLLLQRMDAFVARREFLPAGLVERLGFDCLAFENLHRSGLDFQLILHLLQPLLFEAQGGGDVHELLCEWAGG